MGKYKELIINLIEINANKTGIIILIDYLVRTNRLNELDKTELLGLIETPTYDIVVEIDKIPTIYNASKYLDPFWVNTFLKQYVLANVITQVKANEIKTACGLL